MFWFFGLKACGILVPWSGIEPISSALKGEVLITGLSGKSLELNSKSKEAWFLLSNLVSESKHLLTVCNKQPTMSWTASADAALPWSLLTPGQPSLPSVARRQPCRHSCQLPPGCSSYVFTLCSRDLAFHPTLAFHSYGPAPDCHS